jgi:hypothetical protein
MRLRKIILSVASVAITACLGEARAASPRVVLLSAGASDTAVINSLWPTALPVRALDGEGHVVPGVHIRYAWVGGAPVPVAPTGEVRCSGTSDAVVRATLAELTSSIVVLCRPVKTVRITGPIQFILGDSVMSRPQELPIHAYGPDGREVMQTAGVVILKDSGVAVVRGQTLFPRARGITGVGTHIGDGDGWIGVHVYQRVPALGAIDTLLRVPPDQRLFAVPLRLEPGEFRRQRLPPGSWMLTMLPEDDTARARVSLHVEGAHCQPNLLGTPRRWGCDAGAGARVVVYRPLMRAPDSIGTSYLLVRWLFN